MSVLAHLVTGFRDKPENVASRALYHILAGHAGVRRRFLAMLRSVETALPEDVSMQMQVRDPKLGQPDLIGRDPEGRIVLVIEAKFWAGLTGNQPVSYLSLLDPGQPGCLVFLAPAERIDSLVPVLRKKCADQGKVVSGESRAFCTVGANSMGVLAWEQALSRG